MSNFSVKSMRARWLSLLRMLMKRARDEATGNGTRLTGLEGKRAIQQLSNRATEMDAER
jgi:hypothetical protein